MNFKRWFFQNKNFKLWYYIVVESREYFPKPLARKRLNYLRKLFAAEMDVIQQRVDYYNKVSENSSPDLFDRTIGTFQRPKGQKVYYYDTKEFLRFFPNNFRFCHLAGDIVHVPEQQSIVKSRPIQHDNHNSILLNLDKIRHFNFLQDHIPFEKKKDILFGRASVYQRHRKVFYAKYFGDPMCDLGDIVKGSAWYRPKVSISKHLEYKFIMALEGVDVATNLKWIMSSNSIAVMPKPKFETWFMEGTLIGDFHYIEISDDYSDLKEKLAYYQQNPEKSKEIIRNANAYVKQFMNPKREDLISLMVLEKMFILSNQYEN